MGKRRWYRLHLVTWLSVFIVGAALVWSQLQEELLGEGGGFASADAGTREWYVDFSYFGWPFASVFQTTKTTTIPPRPPTIEREWALDAILLNCLVCVLAIGSTGFVLEKWGRSSKRVQFSIVSLLGLITVAAILLTIINQRVEIYEYFGERLMPSPMLREGHIAARVAGIPILFALACTIYTAGWLVVRLARSLYSLAVRRPA